MKYKTEEERKQAKREYLKQRYQINKEKILEQKKQYYQDNKEKRVEYAKQRYQTNKEKIAEQQKQYNQTSMRRAKNLVSSYNQTDKQMGRGECTLTAQWIVKHIFSQKCLYCGESDWRKLGCDRIDNSLPHTEDNVVPCCGDCNTKRGTKTFEEFLVECKTS